MLLGIAVLGLVACDGDRGGAGTPTPPGSVSGGSAARALAALCEMTVATGPEPAGATFYDRAHVSLHAIAAAAGEVDREAEGTLLVTMQRVEADLERPELPVGFTDDVGALRVATVAALELIELPAPACSA